ncbi:hypothetical protein LSTR_LSTR000269 [Laodelphax striatellus]|uniref:Uncharacterized protein n=1 Tax=Laodelphax striatellus TaxID=195883 RepID=A0A482X6L3_LAOST|nr:hypothetical protein LSTR_LSTR000269 [Laodelphax striatellus]
MKQAVVKAWQWQWPGRPARPVFVDFRERFIAAFGLKGVSSQVQERVAPFSQCRSDSPRELTSSDSHRLYFISSRRASVNWIVTDL